MKTTSLNLGKRLYTPPILLAALLIITSLALVTSAKSPQGPGGQELAKPRSTKSPTTKKASSRSTNKVASLEGTVWDVREQGTVNSYEFLRDGKLKFSGEGSGEGMWYQTGTRIMITFGEPRDPFKEMTGSISSKRMSGTVKYYENGKKPTTHRWSATRNR
jgi:hypothetical protein